MTRRVDLTDIHGDPWSVAAEHVSSVCWRDTSTACIRTAGDDVAVMGTYAEVAEIVWPESTASDRVTVAARDALQMLDWCWPAADPAEPSDMRDLIAKAAAAKLRAALGGVS